MVDFMQKMHVFKTVIFDFGIPFNSKQVVNPPKPLYFQKVHFMVIFTLFRFFEKLL